MTHKGVVKLIEGGRAPWLIPYCASCKEGVEGMTFLPVQDGKLIVDVQCHGKTTGLVLTEADINRMNVSKKPIVVFEAPLQHLVDVVIEA